MGHAHHFLARLDRVSHAQVELALALYNDPSTVKFILGHARLPERAPRVAISLADPEEGPFLVVTREGHFVTCLGRGMRATNLPVLTRERFDALHARAGEHKARVEMQLRLAPDESAGWKLLRQIFNGGENVTREEFAAMGALQPVVWPTLYTWLADSHALLYSTREVLRNERVLKPRHHEVVKNYRQTLWSLKHLYLLLGLDAPREQVERFPIDTLEKIRHPFSTDAVEHGMMPVALAAAWFTARFDDLFVPILRHRYEHATRWPAMFQYALDLFAIASRCPSQCVPVRDALCLRGHDDPDVRRLDALREADRRRFDDVFERPGHIDVSAAKYGASLLAKHYDPEAAKEHGWATIYDVPLDVARPYFVNLRWNFFEHPNVLDDMLRHMPSVARLRAEDFYFPAEWHARFRDTWPLDEMFGEITKYYGFFRKREPVRAAETAGRNDPCPCSSGKKYKKCCALAPAPASDPYEERRAAIERDAPSLATVVQQAVAA